MTLYAIGDIHGQLGELERALALIEADGGQDARIVFVGDYTDRGPHSRQVIERLVSGCEEGRPWTCLKGNHDRMFLRYVTAGIENDDNIRSGLSWLNPRLGGAQTLASYGLVFDETPGFLRPKGGVEHLVEARVNGALAGPQQMQARARDAVSERHLRFLESCPLWHREAGFIFVHAGIRPGTAMEEQSEEDLIWIRDGFLDDPRDHGAVVVHGHTAVEAPEHHGNRINIDSGAGYGRPITAAALTPEGAFVLGAEGRARLSPEAR
ncbi:metallophosphoesterase family protein [Profundibacterium mesophilum]|uniref:Serinethreonine protein phosphatase I n=1 Tax=Profundibacterium mesophilum KAUST100406-0324 TaxID=1037889 RepID=A0A921TDM8_9RHOB|nr:metallophosphoesterase family protein [Profundibacterium mesophilum]KAF0676501.1 Serinethreonine protein phosphatase I [Profundibacterium mesophilum KAUST100406-0324]